MQINFSGNDKDISMILVSAVRYALGRRTYIVSWTCDLIKNNIHLLTQLDKQVITRDIQECSDLGDDCDIKCWYSLLNILKNDIPNKGSINENRG